MPNLIALNPKIEEIPILYTESARNWTLPQDAPFCIISRGEIWEVEKVHCTDVSCAAVLKLSIALATKQTDVYAAWLKERNRG